jgi:hypothetical protein
MQKRLPFSFSLVLVGVVQLTFLALLVSVIAYVSGRRSTLSLAKEFSGSVTERIVAHLDQLVKAPVLINRLNLSAIQSNQLRLSNTSQLESVFWQQMQLFPVGYINYGSADGTFVGLERLDNGQIYINEMGPQLGPRVQAVYAVGAGGVKGPETKRYLDIGEASEETWYTETAAAGRSTWSSIYQWDDNPNILSISHNQPIYGENKRLIGVIGVDLILTQLSSYLASLWGTSSGLVLILEPDGKLVASSRPGGAMQKDQQGKWRRLTVNQVLPTMGSALQRDLRQLAASGGGPVIPDNSGGFLRVLDGPGGDHYFVNLRPWRDRDGLNWLIVVLIPQARFVAFFNQEFGLVTAATAFVLFVSIVVNLALVRRLLQPLHSLTEASETLSQGLLDNPIDPLPFSCVFPASSPREFESLRASLNTLVNRFNDLVFRWRQSSELLLQHVETQRPGPDATPVQEAFVSQPDSVNVRELDAFLHTLQTAWEQRRGPTSPPLQVSSVSDTSTATLALPSNLESLLCEQLEQLFSGSHPQPDPELAQLHLQATLRSSGNDPSLQFRLMGPPELLLLRLALPVMTTSYSEPRVD